MYLYLSEDHSLPSSIEKELQEIKELINYGKFQQALPLIEALTNKKGISKEDLLSNKILKSMVLDGLGKREEALSLAEEALKESEGLGNTLLQVDALIRKIMTILYTPDRQTEFFNSIEKGLELLQTIPSNVSTKELAERKAILLTLKARAVWLFLGDAQKNLELGHESFSNAKESGNKRIIAGCLIILGNGHFHKNDYRKAEEFYTKAKKIIEEISNELLFIYYYQSYARFLVFAKREFDQAIELYKEAVNILKRTGCADFNLPATYNDMGVLYRDYLLQLDKALDCFIEALEGFKRLDIPAHIALRNIGHVYHMKYDIKQAQKYFIKSMKISEEINERYKLPTTLYNLITITLELNNFQQAKVYLNRLKKISEETGFERIDQLYRFANILILKESGNISDLVKAAELLREFLKEEGLLADMRLDALYSLLEIRIKELHLSATKEILEEVQKRLHHLEIEAEEYKYQQLLVNIYRLQSQLALLELNANKAIEFLEEASTFADKINVELLKKGIREDQERIEKQLGMWNKLQEQEAPLSETVKLISLESTVKNIKKETVLEERDEETGEIIEYRKLFALKI